jgi:hypothetical protein
MHITMMLFKCMSFLFSFFGRLMWDFPFVTTCDDRFFSSVRGPYDFEFLCMHFYEHRQWWNFDRFDNIRNSCYNLFCSCICRAVYSSVSRGFPLSIGFGILIRGFWVVSFFRKWRIFGATSYSPSGEYG